MQTVRSMQPYMIARKVNEGLVLVETAAPQTSSELSRPAALLQSVGGLVGALIAPRQRKLFLPFDQEGDICIHEVEVLGDDYLKFCEITGIVPGPNFKGSTAKTTYNENGVSVMSTHSIRGFPIGTRMHAYTTFKGDGQRASAIIHELVAIKA